MMVLKHIKTLEKLLLVKEVITQLIFIKLSLLLKHYKVIAIDLSKQQALNVDLRAIQQINFTANLDRAENTTMFSIIEEAKETVLDF